MSLEKNRADIVDPMFGLENMDALTIQRAAVPTPEEYEASFEGGIESELTKLDSDAENWMAQAINIGAESVYSNLAIQAITEGMPAKKAFNMYGFEADEAEAEAALQKEGFMKRLWRALSGFFANFISYGKHMLKVQLISGRVFGNIYKDASELLNKITDLNSTKGSLITEAAFTQPVDIKGHWDTLGKVYLTDAQYTSVITETGVDDVAKLKTFIEKYAKLSGITLEDGKLTMSAVEAEYDKRDESLELAELKNTQERKGSSAVDFVVAALKHIVEFSKTRANQPGAKQDMIKDFKLVVEDAEKIYKGLDAKAKSGEETDKETATALSESFKSVSQLIRKQSTVYNKCLRQYTKVAEVAIKAGKDVLKALEAAK